MKNMFGKILQKSVDTEIQDNFYGHNKNLRIIGIRFSFWVRRNK